MSTKYIENLFSIAKNFSNKTIIKLSIVYSRYKAIKYKKQVVKMNGKTIVNRPIKKCIKEYAKQRFGSSAYWPYLALYSEIRGQFIKGWIPYDYYRYKMLPKMNSLLYSNVCNIKTLDHILFGKFSFQPLFVFISGIFYNHKREKIEVEELNELLSDYNDKIVIKEEFGMGGKQVYIMHSSEFKLEKLNRKINYVIQPYIYQYKTLNDLYPESVNTFKITTYLDPQGTVNVKYVILRFGVDGSKVDNLSLGGQYIFFDSNGKPSQYAYDGDLGFKTGNRHKNTGYAYDDLTFPMYQTALELCRNAHKKYPYVRIIGWDVCIDESGEPKLIEWNASSPSFWEYESVFGPFFMDEAV